MFFAAFASPVRSVLRLLSEASVACLCSSLMLGSGLLAGPSHACAQDDAAASAQLRSPPAEALDHYNRGRAHYHAGRYRDAVVELERALELDPDSPNLVYNLARVYELLGDIERSIAYYERYHVMLPATEGDERERVRGTIARLQGARTHVVREPSSRSPATPPLRVRSERGVADGAFWTLASLSLAALGAGTVTGVLALRAESRANGFVLGADGSVTEREQKAQQADRLALASDAALAAGAVGALTSILLYALRTRPIIEPSVALGGHGLTLHLRGEL